MIGNPRFALALAAAVCGAPAPAAGQAAALQFSAPGFVQAGDQPQEIVAGHFDADGDVDLATANAKLDAANVLLGHLGGAFQFDAGSVLSPSGAVSIAVGDFNGDGRDDLATSDSDEHVTVHLSRADGSFETGDSFVIPDHAGPLTLGDVDGDGIQDVLVASAVGASEFGNGSGSVGVFLGLGDGHLAPVSRVDIGEAVIGLAAGEFNGDGRDDVVALVLGGEGFIFLGNADGTLSPAGNIVAAFNTAVILVDDFDADGLADLATANSQDIKIFLGQGDGSFASPVGFAAELNIAGLDVEDFDADGTRDLAATSGTAVAVLLGNGDGSFATAVSFPVGKQTEGVVAGDFNADGSQDLAVTCDVNDSLAILLNLATPAAVWSQLGSADPGIDGLPVLFGAGTQVAGSPAVLELSHAKPLAPAVLFVGLLNHPDFFKGGTLVPTVPIVILPTTTNASGLVPLSFHWPAGLPSGFDLFYQWAIADPAASQGVALSNALQSITP